MAQSVPVSDHDKAVARDLTIALIPHIGTVGGVSLETVGGQVGRLFQTLAAAVGEAKRERD